MLETVDFSLEDVPKDEYKQRYKDLIEKLVVLQQQARQQGVGLVVLFEGWNGAGKGSRISDLMYNLDARATSVHVTPNLDVEEARSFAGRDQGVTDFFPLMQEFWRALGERGTITFYDRGWYTAAMQQVLYNLFGSPSLPKNLEKKLIAAGIGAKKGKSGKGKKDADSKGNKGDKVRGDRVRGAEALSAVLTQRRMVAEQAYVDSIADFERQLADDGYIVVKFFVHMTKQGQKKRLTHLHDDPATSWRVSEDKLARIGNYEEAYVIYDKLLEGSDFSYAPWKLLNGESKRRTNIDVAETLVSTLEAALFAQPSPEEREAAERARKNSATASGDGDDAPVADSAPSVEVDFVPSVEADSAPSAKTDFERQAARQSLCAPRTSRFDIVAQHPCLDKIDHTLALDEEAYRLCLKSLQKKLNTLENEMFQRRVPLVVMYEGWDAAGKGGNIKRVAQALDARAYTIFPSPAPTRPELMHPHLWRYWTRLPKAGHVGIYDRSWYGRVLVERVEGFATTEQWARAYDEINAFERDLVEWGAILLKFWVDISPDEQLRRFQARQEDPAKQWKITDEDWRNREKYPLYRAAAEDMFRLTSTVFAPWTILESDDKRYARVKALEIIVSALEARLK